MWGMNKDHEELSLSEQCIFSKQPRDLCVMHDDATCIIIKHKMYKSSAFQPPHDPPPGLQIVLPSNHHMTLPQDYK